MAWEKARLREPLRAPSSGRFALLLAVVVLIMMGAAVRAAPRDGHPSDRMTLREIEVVIREAMPLPVVSVVFLDEGPRIGVATNLDTRSVPGAEEPTMHVKFSVERAASRHRVHQAIRAASAQVRAFIAGPENEVKQ